MFWCAWLEGKLSLSLHYATALDCSNVQKMMMKRGGKKKECSNKSSVKVGLANITTTDNNLERWWWVESSRIGATYIRLIAFEGVLHPVTRSCISISIQWMYAHLSAIAGYNKFERIRIIQLDGKHNLILMHLIVAAFCPYYHLQVAIYQFFHINIIMAQYLNLVAIPLIEGQHSHN